MYRTMTMRQTLPSRVVLNTTQGGIAAVLCGVEYDREANSGGSLRRDDEREMPRCSQHEWRHQRGKGNKIVGGLLYGFRFLSDGLMFGWWAFVTGGLLFPCPAEYIRRKINCFYLDMNPNSSPPPPQTVFHRGLSVRVIRL